MDDNLINQPTACMSKAAIHRGAVDRGAGVAFVVEGTQLVRVISGLLSSSTEADHGLEIQLRLPSGLSQGDR